MDKSVTPIAPMPFSGWMVERSENMGWWKGKEVKYGTEALHMSALFDVLDMLCREPERPFSSPMRLPISGIYNKIFFVQLSAGASKLQIRVLSILRGTRKSAGIRRQRGLDLLVLALSGNSTSKGAFDKVVQMIFEMADLLK